MAHVMQDISGFVKAIWDQEFIKSYAARDNLFTLFRMEPAPPGTKYVDVPLFGGVTANTRTIGGGAAVTLQTGTRSSIRVTLDTVKEVSLLTDRVEKLQASVDTMRPLVEETSNALLGAVDLAVLTMLAAYTSLPAAQGIASAAEITDSGTNVADEVERLIMEAHVIMDGLLGVNVGKRFVLMDNWLARKLTHDSVKQSPERSDVPFGYAAGLPNPIQGSPIFPFTGSTTNRTYNALSYTRTEVKFYLCVPDAIAIGVQQLPDVQFTYEGMYRSDLYSAEEVYGLKEGLSKGVVEMTIWIDGDQFGLA